MTISRAAVAALAAAGLVLGGCSGSGAGQPDDAATSSPAGAAPSDAQQVARMLGELRPDGLSPVPSEEGSPPTGMEVCVGSTAVPTETGTLAWADYGAAPEMVSIVALVPEDETFAQSEGPGYVTEAAACDEPVNTPMVSLTPVDNGTDETATGPLGWTTYESGAGDVQSEMADLLPFTSQGLMTSGTLLVQLTAGGATQEESLARLRAAAEEFATARQTG